MNTNELNLVYAFKQGIITFEQYLDLYRRLPEPSADESEAA